MDTKNKTEQMDTIRNSYTQEYIENKIKIPKEVWLLIKSKIDKLLEYGK